MTHSELVQFICKYLNFLSFQRGASPFTRKAYLLDLRQAFCTKGNEKWFFSPTGALKVQTSPLSTPESKEDLLDLSRQAMTRWRPLAASSRNRKIACLKSFLGWLYEEGVLEKNIADQLQLTKVPAKLPHYLSVDEVLAVLRTLEATRQKNQDPAKTTGLQKEEVLILLLYGGGLRVSEACSLKWQNANLRERTLQIQGKGGKFRLISLPEKVIKKLQALPRDGDFIFGKTSLNPRTAYAIVRHWGNAAGLLKPLNPHALRHSYATHMLNSGANLRTLQSLLGHSSLAATEKYLHLGVDELARTLESHHPLARKRFNK